MSTQTDPSPGERADRIERLAKDYEEMTGNELEEGRQSFLAAMLADIRHWCDKHNVDFHGACDLSYSHYLEERTQSDAALRPISSSGGVKSISDDDLCSDCRHCQYQPGEMSRCDQSWPGQECQDGYVRVCPDFVTEPAS